MTKIDITRTELVWPGKYDEDGNLVPPRRVSLPFQVIERVNETRATRQQREEEKKGHVATLFDYWQEEKAQTSDPSDEWRNKLIWGDNLYVMGSLLEKFAGKIDLIYIDPPFATGADFSFSAQIGETDDEIFKDQSLIEEKAYRDTWGNGLSSYLSMMYSRLSLIKDFLSPQGNIFVHCDWHVSHVMRLLLEDIWGKDAFVNEIIWKRKGGSANPQNRLGVVTDSILWFSSSNNPIINPLFTKESPEVQKYIDERFNNVDGNGRHYMKSPIVSPNPRPNLTYDYKGYKPPKNGWSISIDIMEKWDGEGRLYFPPKESGDRIYRKIYLDEYVGQPIQNLWTDVFVINPVANERLNFPTQKPEALLKRIIELASLDNSIIADFFCGSGTTLSVAEKMGRRWIGADLNRYAIHTTRKRLLEISNCKPFEILNLGRYERQIWQRITFEGQKHAQQLLIFEYLKFILELYGAQPLAGTQVLHGKKGSALVHVGAVDAPVTIDEVVACLDECRQMRQKELHILGWEWEMGLANLMVDEAKGQGIKLLMLTIPREVMEQQAVEKGDIHFYELAYLEPKIHSKGKSVTVELVDFVIPNDELIPTEVRQKIKKWSDYVDYWAIDWDFQNDTFLNGWTSYRTRKGRMLQLKSEAHEYPSAGKYRVVVKVIDIFGNDTSQGFDVEVK